LVKLTPAGDLVVTSAGEVGGAIGIVVTGAGTTGDAIFALFGGGVGCVFDGPPTLGDYVTISITADGKCHDAGANYPANVQVLGIVIDPGSTPPEIYLFGPEFRAGTGTLSTLENCSSSASPATCGSASTGSVSIASAATTVVVNTTAVKTNSQIMVQEDSSLAAKLSVTCNTTAGRTYMVTARNAGTSFTITASSAPATDPACLSYVIVN
jgi:hypothetical protein